MILLTALSSLNSEWLSRTPVKDSIMSHRKQSGGSPPSPVTFPASPEAHDNSLEFLGKMEIKHDNLQLMNLRHPLNIPDSQEWFEAIMEAERCSNEIKIIPTPCVWTIRKTLTKSDLTTLRLSVKLVAKHVLSHISVVPTNRSEIIINLHDYDSDSTHRVALIYGKDGYNYFGGSWKENFVQRRGLEKGYEIGLAWNPSTSTFVFGVISGAGSTHYPENKLIIPTKGESPIQ